LGLSKFFSLGNKVDVLGDASVSHYGLTIETVGAMTDEATFSHFRKQTNKVVVTGGDGAYIQLAALETSTVCLILTGNLYPSPLIVKWANEFDFAVLLVRSNTIEAIEAIERIFGKTRLGQTAMLQRFEALVAEHVDLNRLYQALGLERHHE